MAHFKFTAERMGLYVEQLREHGNRTRAAQACGVSASTVQRVRKSDPVFDAEAAEALEAFYDGLEEEAARRARDGVPEPVFYKGVKCGEIQRYSDALLIFLLKGRRREVFGDKSHVEMTGRDGGAIVLTDTERAARVERLLALAAERRAAFEDLC